MNTDILKSSLSNDELKELKKRVAEDIAIIRHGVLCKFPFTGSILMKLNTIPVRDMRLNTACTDGTNIYVDIDFYQQLTKEERIFVIAHEVWHCVLLHFERRQTRDTTIFNYATDMELNNVLKSEGITLPSWVLLPPDKLVNQSAEVIYDYLIKNAKSKNNQNGNSKKSSNSSQENNTTGGPGGNNKSKNSNSSKNFRDNSKPFDKHIYHDNEKDQAADNDFTKDRYGNKGLDKDYNPSIDPNITNTMREAILTTSQTIERFKGSIPDCIASYINRIKKPEISWKEVLNRYITQCFGGERRFGPFNRRHIYNGLYLPSQRTENVNVGLLIDTSGSCMQDFEKFYTEFTNLMNSMGNYHAHIIQCDATVQSYAEYDSKDNPFKITSVDKYKFNGCGGSDFRPAFEFIRKKNLEFDILCCFTDLFIDIPRHKPPYPVLWIVPKTGSNEKPEWGQYLKMNED